MHSLDVALHQATIALIAHHHSEKIVQVAIVPQARPLGYVSPQPFDTTPKDAREDLLTVLKLRCATIVACGGASMKLRGYFTEELISKAIALGLTFKENVESFLRGICDEVKTTVDANQGKIDALANALVESGSLTGEEVEKIFAISS